MDGYPEESVCTVLRVPEVKRCGYGNVTKVATEAILYGTVVARCLLFSTACRGGRVYGAEALVSGKGQKCVQTKEHHGVTIWRIAIKNFMTPRIIHKTQIFT
jgi:hypothetical protein